MLIHVKADDPRLDVYRMLRDKDVSRHEGAFIAEGRIVLEALLEGGRHPLRSVLVSSKRVEPDGDLLARVPEAIPVMVLDHARMSELVGFNIHRGLLAAGSRAAPTSAHEVLAALPDGRATALVLEGLTDTDNVGACFRNAAAFGASPVLLDAPCCDPLYRKAIRVSAGHALRLPFAHGEPIEAIYAALRAHGFAIAALCLSDQASPLTMRTRLDLGADRRLALVVGAEGPGLSRAAIEGADHHLMIPMAPGTDSLNVAVASAVALFALR